MKIVYMSKLDEFDNLVKVINELRLKCPWDKSQTNKTLRTLTIEECYELSDAIVNKSKFNKKRVR